MMNELDSRMFRIGLFNQLLFMFFSFSIFIFNFNMFLRNQINISFDFGYLLFVVGQKEEYIILF